MQSLDSRPTKVDGKEFGMTAQADPALIEAVTAAIARLRFGTVQLTVHDGRVVQLDVTERQRFT